MTKKTWEQFSQAEKIEDLRNDVVRIFTALREMALEQSVSIQLSPRNAVSFFAMPVLWRAFSHDIDGTLKAPPSVISQFKSF
jgi:hypothetical protein